MRGTVETPAGLTYTEELLDPGAEQKLLTFLGDMNLERVSIRGNAASRTVRHFGRRYDYGTRTLRSAEPIPGKLEEVRRRAAEFAGVAPADLVEALVNHYPAGAGIGWHTDAAVYTRIIGISLGAACRMQFRTLDKAARHVFELPLEPRSAYVMQGAASTAWQHRIASTDDERISVTFRSL